MSTPTGRSTTRSFALFCGPMPATGESSSYRRDGTTVRRGPAGAWSGFRGMLHGRSTGFRKSRIGHREGVVAFFWWRAKRPGTQPRFCFRRIGRACFHCQRWEEEQPFGTPTGRRLRRPSAGLNPSEQAPVEILIWPDADVPTMGRDGRPVDRQLRFARDAAGPALQAFSKFGKSVRFTRILPPGSVPGGWDLADALEQGWTAERTSTHLGRFSSPLDGFEGNEFPKCDPVPSGLKLRTIHEPTGSD